MNVSLCSLITTAYGTPRVRRTVRLFLAPRRGTATTPERERPQYFKTAGREHTVNVFTFA